MTIRDALLTELDIEAPFIRRTLERVPLDKRTWKPHVDNDSADEKGGLFR